MQQSNLELISTRGMATKGMRMDKQNTKANCKDRVDGQISRMTEWGQQRDIGTHTDPNAVSCPQTEDWNCTSGAAECQAFGSSMQTKLSVRHVDGNDVLGKGAALLGAVEGLQGDKSRSTEHKEL